MYIIFNKCMCMFVWVNEVKIEFQIFVQTFIIYFIPCSINMLKRFRRIPALSELFLAKNITADFILSDAVLRHRTLPRSIDADYS